MAALTTTVLALASAGDHVIGQKSTYGGTASMLMKLFPRLGISTTQVDQTDPQSFEKTMIPRTRLILVESPSNPSLQITDLRAVADLARAHDVLTLADNTFATPLNQRPTDYGIDLVWHSATKYLNGHSDVSAGVVAGSAELLDRIWDVGLLTGAPYWDHSMPGRSCVVCAHCRCGWPGITTTAKSSPRRWSAIPP